MQFNNKNKFYTFPLTKNIGCIGLFFGILIISIVLFLGFFVGIFVFGFIILFYVYKFFKNKFSNINNTNDINDNVTEAEYIEISGDSDDKN
jgi:uncharacterized membrane protein